jgi:hypothetical protein
MMINLDDPTVPNRVAIFQPRAIAAAALEQDVERADDDAG